MLWITITYLVDLFSFFLSLITLKLMCPLQTPTADEHPPILKALHEGLTFAMSRQELIGSYLIDFTAMVFAIPNALFPAIAQTFGGATSLGLFYAAPAVGALVISFFSGWTACVRQEGKAIVIAAGLWGFTIIGFGMSTTHLYAALLFLALSGAFDAISGIFRTTLWNHVIPQNYRGRLAGIEMISYLGGPKLGDTRAGAIAAWLGVTSSIVSGGVLCVLGVTICCIMMPKFWRYNTTASGLPFVSL